MVEGKEEKTCEGCNSMCCKYVALEIDTPETRKDFEDIKWYVCHKNVNVYVEDDYTWNLEFLTPCEHLDEKGWCKIYEKRPQLCRDYDQEQCLFHNDDYEEKFRFEHIEDVEKYIEEVFDKGLHVINEEPDEDSEEDEEDSDE